MDCPLLASAAVPVILKLAEAGLVCTMFPGLQTLVFPRESKQGGGSWNMEALGKPPVAGSSLLPPSHFQQVPSPFRGEQLALHWWLELPSQGGTQDSGT